MSENTIAPTQNQSEPDAAQRAQQVVTTFEAAKQKFAEQIMRDIQMSGGNVDIGGLIIAVQVMAQHMDVLTNYLTKNCGVDNIQVLAELAARLDQIVKQNTRPSIQIASSLRQ